MAAAVRKPFQGVWNIIRFNWHFYVIAAAVALGILLSGNYFSAAAQPYFAVLAGLVLIPVLVSLAVSTYVYDFSNLYQFTWLPATITPAQNTLLTINAGFDETSQLLQTQFAPAKLIVADFYNPAQHTEVSIKRARRAYPPFPGTQAVETHLLPWPTATADAVFATLAAHEIRDTPERIKLFQEINRLTKNTGRIIVTEHLRDPANFLAYTIGFLHFHSRATWLHTFQAAGLVVEQEIKITPFITSFILRKRAPSA